MNISHAIRVSILCSSCVLLQAWQQPDKPASVSNSYVLGPSDQVTIDVVELPEFHQKTYRVESDGTIDLPLVGSVQAAGLTLAQFKTEVGKHLLSQVKSPHISVSVAETKSQVVSVMGEVNKPGPQEMAAQATLFDVLASAGGLRPDAGDVVTIKRQTTEGPLNLPNAVLDAKTGTLTAAAHVHDVVDLRDPSVNILMRPHDEISVPRARLLYVIGNVHKPGGFTLSEKRSISALEALSLAEGLSPDASPKGARILRKTGSTETSRQQIPVNLKRILDGKNEDIALLPDDILYIPDNKSKRVAAKVAETALATISGVVIWRGL